MKNSLRFFLGLISSLLLSAGFAKAAAHLDPLSNSPMAIVSGCDDLKNGSPARNCTDPCSFAEPL